VVMWCIFYFHSQFSSFNNFKNSSDDELLL
jgi:hypothetical protein